MGSGANGGMVPRRLLRPPAPPSPAISRDVLLARLATGRDERYQATVLWGPPGVGKTQLAAALHAAAAGPAIWLALDGVATLDELGRYLAAALGHALPAASAHAATLLAETPD